MGWRTRSPKWGYSHLEDAERSPHSGAAQPGGSALHSEPDLHRDLKVADVAVDDVAANLGDFEPVEIAERLARPRDPVANRLLDALGRCPHHLGHLVRRVAHDKPPLPWRTIRNSERPLPPRATRTAHGLDHLPPRP